MTISVNKEVKSKVALGAGAARGGPGGEGEHCAATSEATVHTHTHGAAHTRALKTWRGATHWLTTTLLYFTATDRTIPMKAPGS